MPARVHALLVVRPGGVAPAAHRLERMLQALSAQTRPVDAVTIIVCGDDVDVAAFAAEADVAAVLHAPRGTSYADAVRMVGAGGADSPAGAGGIRADAVWLLAQDTLPAPDALAHLADALELAPSVSVAAPKLVRFDDSDQIVSLGVTMTRFGRAVGPADGEFDQGQHDATEDVLGSDVRGILIRAEAWQQLAGLDAGLVGADEGLDLGVRARLAGGQVRVVPAARVSVYGDGVAGLAGFEPRRTAHAVYAKRRAQLHRRLVYAHVAMLPLVWLTLLPVAVWRAAVQLVAKAPARILPEWGAAVVTLVRLGRVARARAVIRRARKASGTAVSWRQLDALRITQAQLRTSLHPDILSLHTGPAVGELRFFAGGGAWAVFGALVVSIALWPALLVWPGLRGGALAPLRATVRRLWADASFGLRPTGLAQVGPADPFSAVMAILGSLWPGEPSHAVVLLWLVALPLAVLGGWFAATRVTDRSVLRIASGLVWALAPTFLAALTQGRPAAVIVHLLLPWLLYAASAAHRSWGAAGAASLLLAGTIACAPSLTPALVVLWIVLLLGILAVRQGHGVARVAWMLVPSLVMAGPVVFAQLRASNPWALLADPGMPWAGPQAAADATGRAMMAAGSPTADPGGWGQILASGLLGDWARGQDPAWLLILLAWLPLLAVAALFTRRWLAASAMALMALLGLCTAWAAAGIAVTAYAGTVVPVWPGSGLSLMWAGVLAGAVLFVDVGFARPDATGSDTRSAPHAATYSAGSARTLGVSALVLAVAVFALPGLTAHLRGEATVTDAAGSTLPAFVEAVGRTNPNVGTLVVTPLADGAVGTQVVWGESQTMGGQSTVQSTRTTATASDRRVATLAADLVTSTSSDVVARLQSDGISFVLLRHAEGQTDRATARGNSAALALNQRDGLDGVGSTPTGDLWRVTAAVTPRAPATAAVRATARGIGLAQLIVVAAALLLAVPTRESRRRARYTSRVIGRAAPGVRGGGDA